MTNTLAVTLSGFPDTEIRLPNGNWRWLYPIDGVERYWHQYKQPKSKILNLVNIESFEAFSCPLIECTIKEKPISRFMKFWWSGWNDDAIYDINIKVVGTKTGTKVYMRSGESFTIDESVECIENALDACIWTADIKEQLEH